MGKAEVRPGGVSAGPGKQFELYSERSGRSQKILSKLTSDFRLVRDVCSCCVQDPSKSSLAPDPALSAQGPGPQKKTTTGGVISLTRNVLTDRSMEKRLFSGCRDLGDKGTDCS